jgi:hypothetical protein
MFWPIPSKHCSVNTAQQTLLSKRCSANAVRQTLLSKRCSANTAQQTLFGKRQPLGMRRSALPAVRKRPPFESTLQQPRENLSASGKLPVWNRTTA